MKYFTVLILLLTFSPKLSALPCTGDTLIADSTRKNKILPAPLINRSPETSWVFGLSALFTFYSDQVDPSTRASFLFPTILYTLKKQLITDLYLNLWSKKNRYHYQIDLSYNRYNYYFYGIGSHTKLSDQLFLRQNKGEINIIVEKKIRSPFFAGIEFDFKNDQYPAKENTNIFNESVHGYNGGQIVRGGFSAIYDTRNDFTYATSGNYLKLTFTNTLPGRFSDYHFSRYIFESRHFISIKQHTLGFNTNIESIQGDQPFFELRPIGGAFIMRGYYTGRFRDQNMAAGQLEYRWHFARRWGLVAFGGGGNVFKNNEIFKTDLKPNYGLGLRYFYDLASGINLRVDYGVGEKIPGEPRIGSFYIFVGEAF